MMSSALDSRISRVRIVTRPRSPVGARAAGPAPGVSAAGRRFVTAAAGSGYGGDSVIEAYGQRYSVRLMTPPRSSCLAPSLGYPVMSISPFGVPWQVRQDAA